MTFLYVFLGWCALEGLRAILYHGFGYRLDVKVVSMAYADGHVLNWHWDGGRRVRNEYDDASDLRHIPRTLRDSGFAVEPLWLRITCKKTSVIRDGGGREYPTSEERLRVHEHQRARHKKVLPDYTEADYEALVGIWTPEREQEKRTVKKAAKRQDTRG